MKVLTKSVVFSRREKLLLGLLGSAMLFSFSFSYGAVNQAKVDSIMQTINTAANNFSSQADRDTYYQRVYTGLSDAIDMLAVVRNNVGAMIGTAPVTIPPIPPTGGANPLPITITNPIANYPIPEPCGPGVKIQKEIMGKSFGGWKKVPFDRTTYPDGVVFRLRIDNVPDNYIGDQNKRGSVWFDPSGGHGMSHARAKISPYPCDFATPEDTANNQCSVGGGRGYFINNEFVNTISQCGLKKGVTYYVNVKANPQVTDITDHHTGITGLKTSCNRSNMPCGFLIQDSGLQPNTPPYWGIYNTYEEYEPYKEKRNDSSENPETLRQKVINDYKTKGMNTDGATGAPSGGAPAPVTNPIANYPIPAPCMAGTVLNQELMGAANGGWIRRSFPKAPDIVPGHVYKLRIDEEDGAGNGSVVWGDAPPERLKQAVKISPYPCDFVTLEQEKKYFGSRINVAPALSTWWNSITVPSNTEIGACMGIASSNNLQYKLGTMFSSPSLSTAGSTCTLVKGVTYYVNVRPSFTHMHGNGCNGTYACNYDLIDGGNQVLNNSRPFWGGNYSQYTQLVSSQSVESLRQKVVSDYATKGVNTDGLTNTTLGGTAVTPPVGTGGGVVVVREGPWERVEDIWCPPTLTGATDGLQTLYPNGYNYTNQGNTYWNVKNFQAPSDISLPATCTTGKKFVKHGMQGTCYVYECKN